MSHFSVLVFSNDDGLSVDELLEPYYEGNTRAPYIDYTRQEAIDYVRQHYTDFKDKTDEECWKFMAEGCITDKQGNIYTTANPDAHWDWWVEGGRWENYLRLKNGERATSARIKDIDFSLDSEVYKDALRFWDIVVEGKPLKPFEKMPFSLWKPEWYLDNYGSREEYAERDACFSTYAVVTPDGIWFEKGEMLWFGVRSVPEKDTKDWDLNFVERFILPEDENTIITIVDCHI